MPNTGKNIQKEKFTRLLMQWHNTQNNRQMPWKGEKDPYKIWLSEIMLQQTRVEQGLKYYEQFIKTFPTIQQLAAAKDAKVFKLWEGLGYYTRCRNLLATARYISKERNGAFPKTYEEIKSLKGVGPYTAAAIASFAFNQPYAVVDGNVFRVLARVFGSKLPIDSAEGKKYFTALANELLHKKEPALFNQAMMDFGAVVCKPVAPLCEICIMSEICRARQKNIVAQLPVKEKKIQIKKRWFYFLVIRYKNEIFVQQRNQKDIWQGLYEFPLIESTTPLSRKKIEKTIEEQEWLKGSAFEIISISPVYKQQLTHQFIQGRFIEIKMPKKPEAKTVYTLVKERKLKQLPFPKFINQYLQQV